MTISVYPSTLPGEPIEIHEANGVTIGEWLHGNVEGYVPSDEPPISITVDGHVIPPGLWPATSISRDQCVEIRPQPKGGVTLIAAVVAGVIAVAATFLLKPSIPNQNTRSTRGSSIYEVSAQGNRPKLGDVIPEIAGRHKTYPDYLTAPRRYFVDQKTQAIDLLLCVGKGEYDIADEDIRIGETPVTLLGGSINHALFNPGQSVTSHVAHRRWYNAPEVGATTGGSGLRLLSTRDLEGVWDGDPALSGVNISGPGQPEGWGVGTKILVEFAVPVTVTGFGSGQNVFTGDISYLMPSVGVEISFDGERRRIASWDSGTNEFTLQKLDGGNLPWLDVDDYPDGGYDLFVTRWFEATGYEITDDSSGFDVKQQFDGVDVAGWPGFPAGTTMVSVEIDQSQLVGIWSNTFLACPKGETTTLLEWDIFAPSGLGFIKENGDIASRSRTIELRYRPRGTTTWTTVSRNISGRTRDQLGWTFSQTIPSMLPEVQLRRVSAEDNDVQALDRLEWYGLRSELPGAKTSYPGVTVLAMTVQGSSTIASQTENQVNVVAHRKLPLLDGSGGWTAPQATRSIAAWMAYVAKSSGHTDDEIDIDELQRLENTWSSRGDTFDFVNDDESTVRETIQRTLRAGMAELTLDSGRLRPVRDEPRTVFEHMYTPQNMLEPLRRTVQAPRPDDPDGVDVEYFSADTWTQETVECRLPGDVGARTEKVRLDGVTDRTRAWRIGMRRRREIKYRRWEYEFATEMDALNSRYLSFCALADDIPGYGQSSLLEMIANEGAVYRLGVSEPMDWTDGASHVVAWRRPDGTLAGPFLAERGDDDYEILATHGGEPAPAINLQQEPPHVLFGTTERWSYPALVQDINPRGFERVNVSAVGYDARVYEDDDNSPP